MTSCRWVMRWSASIGLYRIVKHLSYRSRVTAPPFPRARQVGQTGGSDRRLENLLRAPLGNRLVAARRFPVLDVSARELGAQAAENLTDDHRDRFRFDLAQIPRRVVAVVHLALGRVAEHHMRELVKPRLVRMRGTRSRLRASH